MSHPSCDSPAVSTAFFSYCIRPWCSRLACCSLVQPKPCRRVSFRPLRLCRGCDPCLWSTVTTTACLMSVTFCFFFFLHPIYSGLDSAFFRVPLRICSCFTLHRDSNSRLAASWSRGKPTRPPGRPTTGESNSTVIGHRLCCMVLCCAHKSPRG